MINKEDNRAEFKMVDDNPAPANTCFVPYSKTVFKNKSWQTSLLEDEVQYCCDVMEKELGTDPDQISMPFIIFTSHYDHETQVNSYKLNILQAFPEEFNHESVDFRYRDIDFCPFCGKPIIVKQVKLFKEVVTGCEEVVQKVCKTDIVEVKP
jgi:hypothetical protein